MGPMLTQCVSDMESPNFRCSAGRLLARASPVEARKHVPRLTAEVEAENGTNQASLFALCGLATVAGDSVPLLRRMMSSGDQNVLHMVIQALGDIGPKAGDAVPQ